MNLASVALLALPSLSAALASCGTVPPPPEERARDLPQVRTVTPEDLAKVRELRLEALAALERGEAKAALAIVEQALSFHRGDARTHMVRRYIRMAQAKTEHPPVLALWESAETDFLLATRLDPEDPEVFFGLGSFYAEDGHVEAALAAFRKGLDVDPNHKRTLTAAGRILHQHGREREALPLLERLSAFPEQDPDVVYRLGQCRAAVGRFTDAAQTFRQYRELAPKDPEGPLAEAWSRWKALAGVKSASAADSAAILALFASAAELAPKDPRPPFDSALFLEERGERAQAEALYGKALALAPDHVPTLLNLAHLHEEAGRVEEARALLTRALPLLEDSREKRAVEAWLAGHETRG